MLTLDHKKQIVEELIEKFKRAQSYYLVDFTGMTVKDSLLFRRELRKEKIEFRVAKNTLILRAFKEIDALIVPEKILTGQTAIIFGYEDAVAPARLLKVQFEKFNKPLLKAAVLEGVYYDSSQLKIIAALPSKKDLMASIVGSLQSPVSGIVGSINAVMRDLANVIEVAVKSKAA
jgi:large subunit ribosomal protein L10